MPIWRKSISVDPPAHSPASGASEACWDDARSDGDELRLGRGVHVRGGLTGARDVILEGTAFGRVSLPDHAFTVGPKARVTAEVFAKRVIVEGEFTGTVVATDTAIIASTGSVSGNVFAPRVVLADGCSFDGGVNYGHTMPTERSDVARKAESKPAPLDPGEGQTQSGELEQGWSGGCESLWTMDYAYDERPSKPERPMRAGRRTEKRRTGARPSVVDSTVS